MCRYGDGSQIASHLIKNYFFLNSHIDDKIQYMNLSVGIVGLPNVGKSTLFNALIKRQLAKVAEYPFTTIDPHEGMIDVADERLTDLTLMLQPERSTPATITFIDIAGLVSGAHKGEGLGNEFLGQIREVDAILHVVRAFENADAAHVMGTVEPQRDMEIIGMELVLKDLDTIKKLIDKEDNLARKALFLKIKESLNKNIPIRDFKFTPEELQLMEGIEFLTAKPVFYILNISENELGSAKQHKIEEKDFLVICAKLEADLIELATSEQQEYLRSVGVNGSGLEKVIQEAYSILNLITFFTVKGGKEVKAWPIKKGSTVLAAAGMVHEDMQKGFIKAEVINYKDFVDIGLWHKAHEEGKIRFEGKDYVVSDGDIIEFKFKV